MNLLISFALKCHNEWRGSLVLCSVLQFVSKPGRWRLLKTLVTEKMQHCLLFSCLFAGPMVSKHGWKMAPNHFYMFNMQSGHLQTLGFRWFEGQGVLGLSRFISLEQENTFLHAGKVTGKQSNNKKESVYTGIYSKLCEEDAKLISPTVLKWQVVRLMRVESFWGAHLIFLTFLKNVSLGPAGKLPQKQRQQYAPMWLTDVTKKAICLPWQTDSLTMRPHLLPLHHL